MPAGCLIIGTNNNYPELRDPWIGKLEAGKVESVQSSEQIGRAILQVLNNIFSKLLA